MRKSGAETRQKEEAGGFRKVSDMGPGNCRKRVIIKDESTGGVMMDFSCDTIVFCCYDGVTDESDVIFSGNVGVMRDLLVNGSIEFVKMAGGWKGCPRRRSSRDVLA